MMPGLLVWLRWLQYVDLGLVFGVPFTLRLLGEGRLGGGLRLGLGLGSLVGLALTGAVYVITIAQMAGSDVASLDRSLMITMLTGTALGWSILARTLALLAMPLLLPWVAAGHPSALAGLGAIAVASLAWGGHAAASQDIEAVLRIGADVLHLWAGLTWLGALVLFTASLWRIQSEDRSAVARVTRWLGAFSLIGTVLVGLLTICGIANLLYLAPPAQWPLLASTPYGTLMLAKLALFAAMFGLAAHNRFRLVPALEMASGAGSRARAIKALRRSVSLENLIALGVLWCVAFAGTLDPFGNT